ncbi:MAG: hypothetical protein ACPG8W_09285 [Candidatus Promineifilaceae bacterium]
MIKETERAFVHQPTVGYLKNCRKIMRDLHKQLRVLYTEKRVRGFRLFVIKDLPELRNSLAYAYNYKKVTKGEYPFVYAGIQPFDENPQSFEELMLPLGFIACEQKPLDMDDVYASPFYEDLMSRPSSDD